MKILVAQSDVTARAMLETLLTRWGHDVVLAETGPQAFARLMEQGGPSLAILEEELAGQGGLDICYHIRAKTELPNIYFIMVMDEKAGKGKMEALQAGVDDFLSRPLDADEIVVRLRIAKRILELQDDLKRANDSIRYQTLHDPLTGLVNRTEAIGTVGREVSRMRREKATLSVILAGIDDLKGINAKYGNAAGDAVLREVVRRMRSVIRPYDTIGRYTGEQFLVVVPGCDVKSATTHADRLRAAVAQGGMDISEWGKFSGPRDAKLQVTLSLGVAEGRANIETSALLRDVEAAQSRAEQSGRNRVVPHLNRQKK